MRLISLSVRNYRIHRDFRVEFDPQRHLIGGSNETGKSTLAEAMHRVLFMRHRAGGDVQKSMVSHLHAGVPEVTLSFHAAGETWTIEKQFAGTKGKAQLRSAGGVSLQGDAAEEKLAALIGNPEGAANRLNELANRWSHLWVWQGTAGNDAATHAANRRDELVQRLQQQGLAAVMQSATDERAREKIRQVFDEMFTRTGTVKAGSRLDLASKSLAEAEGALARAIEQKQRLEAAIHEQETATKILEESLTALPAKHQELSAATRSLAQANELRSRGEKEQLVFQNAAATCEQLAKADQQIRQLRSQAAAARDALVPADAALATLAAQELTAHEAAGHAEQAHRAISEAVRLARQHHDLAAAAVSRFEKSSSHEALSAKAGEIATIGKSLAADREALSKLPNISPNQLESLRQLDAQAGQAESALNAIAAGIELVASHQEVLLDGKPLETGESRVITETTELRLGGGTLLRIQPGGGTSLAESRLKLEDLRKKFTTALDRLAIRTLAEAAEIVAKRQLIAQGISNIESRLQALGARDLPDALALATAALTAASAEVEHRQAAFPPETAPALPDSLEAARTWQLDTRATLQQAENDERSLLIEASTRREAHQQAAAAVQARRESLEAARKTLEAHEQSARILEQNHGDATQRAAALEIARNAQASAQAALDATTNALAELHPELLQQQVTRLHRVISIEEEKQREARTRIAVAKNTLALDGSSDPEAELLHARARHDAAAGTHSREKRHADAIALLHRLFSESQAAISESVTQPIADRVAGYLACLFGRGVRVGVDLAQVATASIELTRPGTPTFAFETLSGGAKEQVAAALRLAMAEILAANHDGCLPMVFDDAFAYADDDRIQSLQAMLDLAASRGLQVIVLTCTPGAYIGLGAEETRLVPPLSSISP